jgi:hypothetical protein
MMFSIKKTVTTRFELRVVAVSQSEVYDDGKGHNEALVNESGRVATVSDLIDVLRADAATRDLVLRAFVPGSLLDGLTGNAAQMGAYQQHLPPGFGTLGMNHNGSRSPGKE